MTYVELIVTLIGSKVKVIADTTHPSFVLPRKESNSYCTVTASRAALSSPYHISIWIWFRGEDEERSEWVRERNGERIGFPATSQNQNLTFHLISISPSETQTGQEGAVALLLLFSACPRTSQRSRHQLPSMLPLASLS